MKEANFNTKISFLNSKKNIKNGKFLIKKDNNKISGLFDYKDNQITILKSNIRNRFIDGKLSGNLIFLPYFDFNLDLNLNSINFTKVYNYFLSLDKEEQVNWERLIYLVRLIIMKTQSISNLKVIYSWIIKKNF